MNEHKRKKKVLFKLMVKTIEKSYLTSRILQMMIEACNTQKKKVTVCAQSSSEEPTSLTISFQWS